MVHPHRIGAHVGGLAEVTGYNDAWDVPKWFHAVKPKPAWQKKYENMCAVVFDAKPQGFEFHGTLLRIETTALGLEPPAHKNHWGAVANSILRSWKAKGLIVETGAWAAIDNTLSEPSHGHKYRIYRKVVP